jgi:hypothetical protein
MGRIATDSDCVGTLAAAPDAAGRIVAGSDLAGALGALAGRTATGSGWTATLATTPFGFWNMSDSTLAALDAPRGESRAHSLREPCHPGGRGTKAYGHTPANASMSQRQIGHHVEELALICALGIAPSARLACGRFPPQRSTNARINIPMALTAA